MVLAPEDFVKKPINRKGVKEKGKNKSLFINLFFPPSLMFR